MSSYTEEENVGSSYLEPAFPWKAPECLDATSKRQNAKDRDRKDSAARRKLEGSSAQQGRELRQNSEQGYFTLLSPGSSQVLRFPSVIRKIPKSRMIKARPPPPPTSASLAPCAHLPAPAPDSPPNTIAGMVARAPSDFS